MKYYATIEKVEKRTPVLELSKEEFDQWLDIVKQSMKDKARSDPSLGNPDIFDGLSKLDVKIISITIESQVFGVFNIAWMLKPEGQ